MEKLKEIIDEEQLEYESYINVCRYVDGEKEYLNEDGQISVSQFDKLLQEKKATFQFHQPQRFCVSTFNVFQRIFNSIC